MKNSRKSVQGITYAKTQRQKRRAREGSLEEKVPPLESEWEAWGEGIPDRRIEVGKGTGV